VSGSEKSDDITTAERIMQAAGMYYRQDMTQSQIADVLGVSQPAVSDLLRKTHRAMRVQKSLEDYVTDHYAELQFLKAEAASIPKLAQKIEVLLQILDREMKLLGTTAPTKSIHAHVDAAGTGRFHEVIEASAGLDEEQFKDGLRYMREKPRKQLQAPAGPPPLELTEGE
jgi:DNA-binding transcriptional regulator LsrR (DeoR family)